MKYILASIFLLSMLSIFTKYETKSILRTDRKLLYKRQSINTSTSANVVSNTPTLAPKAPKETTTITATEHKTITKEGVHHIYTTILVTTTSVVPPRVEYITTTNQAGETSVFSTYIPPSTVEVVESLVSPLDTENYDGSSNSLNAQGLWGIGIAVTIVFSSTFYMLIML